MYARYTEVLRDLIQNPYTKECIDKALSNYPLYQGKKLYDMIPTREQLNTKLLNHHKYKEIGFETPGRFFDELEITMNEIMPLYNEMYKTVEIMADLENPFDNVDITESFEQTRSDTSESEGMASNTSSSNATNGSTTSQEATGSATSSENSSGNGTESNIRKHSDTPQNSIGNYDSYLSEYTKEEKSTNQSAETSGMSSNESTSNITNEGTSETSEEGQSTSSSSSTSSGTLSHTFKKKGNQGVNTYAHDMNEFRTSIIDITNQIINDERINNLFMLIW